MFDLTLLLAESPQVNNHIQLALSSTSEVKRVSEPLAKHKKLLVTLMPLQVSL